MDHDRLFKELLSIFFVEFVALFLPYAHASLDPASVEFLDKEVFTEQLDELSEALLDFKTSADLENWLLRY
jgi:hypothetical protein